MNRKDDRAAAAAAFAAGERIGLMPDGSEGECPYNTGALRAAWLDGLMMGRIKAHLWLITDQDDDEHGAASRDRTDIISL